MVITKILQQAYENTTFSENVYNIDSFSFNALYCLFLSDHLIKSIFYAKKKVTVIISSIIHTLSQKDRTKGPNTSYLTPSSGHHHLVLR